MKKHCDFHATRTAHWSCSKCGALLCSDCVSKREQGGIASKAPLHFCPRCNLPMDWVGVANVIDPFWNRMPRIFSYPFAVQPLVFMAVVSGLTLFFSGAGIFSMLMRAIIWLIVLKYSFESLKATARGDLNPPPISLETISDDFQQVFKQFGIYLLIFLASGWVAATLGVFPGYVAMVLLLFLVPAMVILLVTTGSFLHAINPLLFVRLAVRIGWGYLVMFIFLMLLGSAPAFLAHYIIRFFPDGLNAAIFGFAKSFYTIVSYHMMGYVILQYHDRIGYHVDYEDFKDPSADGARAQPADPDAAVLTQITPLIQDGRLEEAIGVIKQMTGSEGIKGLNLSERYYTLLKMKKRTAQLLEHGVRHLELLAAQNERKKALAVYGECLKLDGKFLPKADTLFKIGGWLNESGKIKAAVGVYNRLVKAYSENPLSARAYFRAAQIFHDRLMSTEKARAILKGVMRKYPNHEIIPHVENYLAHLQGADPQPL